MRSRSFEVRFLRGVANGELRGVIDGVAVRVREVGTHMRYSMESIYMCTERTATYSKSDSEDAETDSREGIEECELIESKSSSPAHSLARAFAMART